MSTPHTKSHHTFELPVPVPDATGGIHAATWVQLLPAGTFGGRDGRGPYTVDVAAVVAATRARFGTADMPLDYGHQIEFAPENGKPAPASGWVKEFDTRTDGVWARVEWTDRAAAAILAREYRYISPVFYHDESGNVTCLESAALTNLPNLHLKALSSARSAKETPMSLKAIAQALGLPPDTDEAAIAAHAAAVTAAVSQAGTVLQASGGPEGLVKAAQAAASKAAQADAPDPAKFVPVAVHDATAKELATVKAAQAAAHCNSLVDEARSAGKITPAMEDWAKAYASSSPDGFKAWAALAPDLRPGGGKESMASAGKPGDNASALSDVEKSVCATMGISEDEFKKARG